MIYNVLLISDVLQSESDIDRQIMCVYGYIYVYIFMGFSGDSVVKKLPASAQDARLIPASGRSPGGENGIPHQYSCLGNPMDRGAWQATVHGVTKVLDMT